MAAGNRLDASGSCCARPGAALSSARPLLAAPLVTVVAGIAAGSLLVPMSPGVSFYVPDWADVDVRRGPHGRPSRPAPHRCHTTTAVARHTRHHASPGAALCHGRTPTAPMIRLVIAERRANRRVRGVRSAAPSRLIIDVRDQGLGRDLVQVGRRPSRYTSTLLIPPDCAIRRRHSVRRCSWRGGAVPS
jgi:hypothetical protein